MQSLYDLYTWFTRSNINGYHKDTESMNFIRLLSKNVIKKSFFIRRVKPQKAVKTSLSQPWPDWSGWNNFHLGVKTFGTDSYHFYALKNKLFLNKDILIKERYKILNSGSSVDSTENIFLLFAFDLTFISHSVQYNKFFKELEEYFEFVAGKDNDRYVLLQCNHANKLIDFCQKLIEKCIFLGSVQNHISSITTFSLEDSVLSDHKNIVSHYSGNIRLGQSPWNLQSERDLLTANFCTLAADGKNSKENLTNSVFKKAPLPSSLSTSNIHSTSNQLSPNPSKVDSSVEARMASKLESLKNSGKPPNILVYTGSNDDTPTRFTNVLHVLQQCLSREHYAVYHLKRSHVTTTPWIENAVLLVLAADKVPRQGIAECFLAYFVNGGTLLSLACNFDELFLSRCSDESNQPTPRLINFDYLDWKDVSVLGGSDSYADMGVSDNKSFSLTTLARDSHSNMPLVVCMHHAVDKGTAIFSRISFERDSSDTAVCSDMFVLLKQSNPARLSVFKHLLSSLALNCDLSLPPPLTPFLLFSPQHDKLKDFMSIINEEIKDNVYKNKKNTYKFLTSEKYSSSNFEITSTSFPVLTDTENVPSEFNINTYKRHLNTKVLGNVAFYADVITTTMTVMENFMYLMPPHLGLVVIATTQNAGQGRGGNVWLSPKGCGLFSLHIRFPISSPLGHHLSCVQHLVALAIVLSVRDKPGYEDINLRIKWPNDVYFGESLKLGGVLVRSTILQDTVHINLGCGLNISNKDPTLCVNDLITQFNNNILTNTSKKPLSLFSVEEFVARLINQIERLLENFQADDGESFFDLYYQYWLHNDQMVTLNSLNGPRGIIVGLSRYGFLSVRLEDGTLTEVHPDGNSFDMMKNLIAPKIKR